MSSQNIEVFYQMNLILYLFHQLYIFHHKFKAGKSKKWWGTAYQAISPGFGWDDAVTANKEKGF